MADSETRFRVAPHVASRHLDETTILAELRDGAYFELDAVGSVIWKELAEGARLEELVATVTSAFDVDEATARADVQAFLADLVERGLIDSTR